MVINPDKIKILQKTIKPSIMSQEGTSTDKNDPTLESLVRLSMDATFFKKITFGDEEGIALKGTLLIKDKLTYAALEPSRGQKWSISEFIAGFDDNIQDLFEALELEFEIKEIDLASAKEEEEEENARDGFGFGFKSRIALLGKELDFYFQLAKSNLVSDFENKNYSFNLAPDLKIQLSEIPGIGIKLDEPLVLDVQRLPYTTGDDKGRFYKPIENDKGDITDVEIVPTKSGFSFAVDFQGPDFLKLAEDIGQIGMETLKKTIAFKEETENSGEADDEPGDQIEDNTGGNLPISGESSDDDSDDKKVKYEDGVLWINLKKKMGPLYIGRIGLSYSNGKITAEFDASVSFTVFKMAVIGLRIRTYLNPKKMFSNWPEIDLDGLSLYLKAGSVEIGGLLVKMSVKRFNENGTPKLDKDGKQVTDIEFVGQLVIKLPSFTIIGTGIFGEIEGSKSIFIYGFLNMTLGGPPFFVVEGLALGFGYNRACKVPLEKVSEFPLVKQALNLEFPDSVDDVKKLAKDLVTYLPAEKGTLIIMLGIKFSTFEVITSFALVVITISEKPRIDLLGLSQLVLGEDKDNAVVFIELALKASIDPTEGIVEVLGLITPTSFIFDKDCNLSGGFAFKAWFLGEHAGDFVITIGGYHPRFKKPDHYPTVPRIALNWKVSDALSMKAEAYFALTPSACMAGGSLEMHFHTALVTADFVARANFLISWKPFFYDVEVYVSIKLSVHIYIESAWWHPSVNISMSLDAGAGLHIWGPEFSGKGTVHFHVRFFGIKFGFSADIEFGSTSSKTPPKLSWSEFREGLLPTPEIKEELLGISINDGLIKEDEIEFTVEGQKVKVKNLWILNKKTISIAVNTPIPITYYTDDNDIDGAEKPIFASWKGMTNSSASLTITPMGNKSFTSQFSIAIQKIDENGNPISVDTTDTSFEIKHSIRKNMPASLWGGASKNKDGTLIKNLASGFEIVYVQPPTAGATSKVPSKNFKFNKFFNNRKVNYTTDNTTINFNNETDTLDTLLEAIGKDNAKGFTLLDTNKMISYKEFITEPDSGVNNKMNILSDIDAVEI